jgi:hypothetical protein
VRGAFPPPASGASLPGGNLWLLNFAKSAYEAGVIEWPAELVARSVLEGLDGLADGMIRR